jgi:hypothetical protein
LIGSTTCHTPLSFLSVVVSPLADFTRISSILSAWMLPKTFSCLDVVSSAGFFEM